MADSTACSASSEYGGRRSRYGSRAGGAIEYSSSELDIVPRRSLPGGIPQQRGGVVRDDQRHPEVAVNLSSELPDGKLRLQKRLRGEGAERDDRFGANELDLADEIWTARRHFLGPRISISRRPMLEHVA